MPLILAIPRVAKSQSLYQELDNEWRTLGTMKEQLPDNITNTSDDFGTNCQNLKIALKMKSSHIFPNLLWMFYVYHMQMQTARGYLVRLIT